VNKKEKLQVAGLAAIGFYAWWRSGQFSKLEAGAGAAVGAGAVLMGYPVWGAVLASAVAVTPFIPEVRRALQLGDPIYWEGYNIRNAGDLQKKFARLNDIRFGDARNVNAGRAGAKFDLWALIWMSRSFPMCRSGNGMTDGCDQLARDTANAALARIDKHEDVCAERWRESRENHLAIRKGIEGLYNRFWLAALAVIGILLSTSGYLIAHSLFAK
jgi:hypothetical protein